jgi:hypothetical protein
VTKLYANDEITSFDGIVLLNCITVHYLTRKK